MSGFFRFTEDSRVLYFCRLITLPLDTTVGKCFGVFMDAQRKFSLDVTHFPSKPLESECHSVGGFLSRDPLPSEMVGRPSDFVLNRQSLLRNEYSSSCIEMIYRDKVTESVDVEDVTVVGLAFSLTGETIYMMVFGSFRTIRIMAWDVSNWKFKAEKEFSIGTVVCRALAVRGGVLIATLCTLELWNFELSNCIRQWSLYVKSMFSISDDQVLCKTTNFEEVIVDTVTGDIVSPLAVSSYESIACYRNLHLLANNDGGIKLQQLGQSVPRWELSLKNAGLLLGCFSPKGQFIVVVSFFRTTYVLDEFDGNMRFKLSDCDDDSIYDFKFISDEEIVILSKHFTSGVSLRLFSVRSGDILSVLRVYSCNGPPRLATCPSEGLIAICSSCKSDLKVIKVKLSKEKKCIRNGRKVSWQIVSNHL